MKEDAQEKAVAILDKVPKHRVADGMFWEHLGCFLQPLFTRIWNVVRERGWSSHPEGDLSTHTPSAQIRIYFSADTNNNSPYLRIEGDLGAEEVTIVTHNGAWPTGPRRARIPVQRTTESVLTDSFTMWLDDAVSIHRRSRSRQVLFKPLRTVIDQIRKRRYWNWIRKVNRDNIRYEIGNLRANCGELRRDWTAVLCILSLLLGSTYTLIFKGFWGVVVIVLASIILLLDTIKEMEKEFTPKINWFSGIIFLLIVAILAHISLVLSDWTIEGATGLSADSFPESKVAIAIVIQTFCWSILVLAASYFIGIIVSSPTNSYRNFRRSMAAMCTLFAALILVRVLPTWMDRYTDKIIVWTAFHANGSPDAPQRRICDKLPAHALVNMHEGNRVIVARRDENESSFGESYVFKDLGECRPESTEYIETALPQVR